MNHFVSLWPAANRLLDTLLWPAANRLLDTLLWPAANRGDQRKVEG